MIIRLLSGLIMCIISSTALAHKNSDSYLQLQPLENKIALRWDIALSDLNRILKLDSNNDGRINWGEVRRRHEEITATAFNSLTIHNNGAPCSVGNVKLLISFHNESAYAVLKSDVVCSQNVGLASVKYDFLFEEDARHRGLISIKSEQSVSSHVFTPDNRTFQFGRDIASLAGFTSFFVKGIEHLLGGIDHLLFLFVLLLPAITGRFQNNRQNIKHALLETVKILTAFTIAHAITLTLSVLKLISIPATPVEIVIAVSVAIAAFDNIRPFMGAYRWAIAGGFGLIHGLGFANALGPLVLSPEALLISLLAFNLGLEAAQVGIAVFLLPVGHLLLRYQETFAQSSANTGSAIAIMIAMLWTIDRSFGLSMIPF